MSGSQIVVSTSGWGLIGAEPVPISLGDLGWNPHPEVWLLTASLVAIAFYMRRVLEPKAIAAGYPAMTGMQRFWFLAAGAGMWVMSDWPIHDVAEQHLYFVHMVQHLFISMLIPAMFLLAIPSWLFHLLVPEGSAGFRFLAKASHPVVAGVTFNAVTLLLHWSALVDLSARSGPAHFAFHLMVFAAGLMMWMPVLSPYRPWRIGAMGQCIFLFLMSITPTVPSGWLVFAEDVVYRHYDTPTRLWGIDVLSDQQAAGVIMKLLGGFFLWGVIVVIFSRWATEESRRDIAARRTRHAATLRAADASVRADAATVTADAAGMRAGAVADVAPGATGGATVTDADGRPLTFEEVAEEFSRTPAPSEPRP